MSQILLVTQYIPWAFVGARERGGEALILLVANYTRGAFTQILECSK
jgi:hypothetical protein